MIRDRQAVARVLVERGCRTDLLMAAALGDADRVRHHLDANPSSIRMTVSDRWFPKQNPRSGGTIYIWTLGGHKSAHVIAREFGRAAAFDLLMERSPAPLKLVVACELGDTDLIRTLVTADGAIVRSLDDADRGAITAAAERNQAAVVNRMLALGWPTDGRGDHRATALHWAAFHGNAGMVRDLLDHHALVDVRDPVFDGTPLDWAIHGSLKSWHSRTGDYGATVDALLAAGSTPPSDIATVNASEAVRAALRRQA
jgi:hypothetical protein